MVHVGFPVVSRFLSVTALLLLVACGGGGGGGASGGGGVALGASSVSFDIAAGTSSPPMRDVSITAPGAYRIVVGYPGGSRPSWVTYALPSMSTLRVRISMSPIAAGSYTDTVYVQAERVDGSIIGTAALVVRLTVTDPLALSRDWLEYNTAIGATSVASQTIRLSKVATAGQWTASVDQSWLTLSSTSGTLPATLTVTAAVSGLAQGSYSTAISIRDVATGQTQVVPVTLNIEPHKLFVAQNGVALTTMPSRTRLSHTITVSDNGHIPTAWTASTSQPWVTVSPASGTTDGPLTVTADPTGLAADTIHYATVAVTASDPTVAGEIIKVGLYIRSSDPAYSVVNGPAVLAIPVGLVSDPVRPYVYASFGDARVDIYNVHDQSLVRSLVMPAGSDIRALTVSSDGALLYAVDHGHSVIVPIDLELQTAGAAWPTMQVQPCANLSTQENCPFDIAYARPNSHPVLLTGDNQILDARSGAALASFTGITNPLGTPPILAAAPNGESVYARGYAASSTPLVRYQLRYSDVNSVPVAARIAQRAANEFGYTVDIAVSPDSSAVYTTIDDGASMTGVRRYAAPDLTVTTTLATPGAPTSNVAIGPTGIIYGGSAYTVSSANNVVAYNGANVQIGSYLAAANVRRQLAISGDGLRLIARSSGTTGSSVMRFISVAP